jgi:hypothetical protein
VDGSPGRRENVPPLRDQLTVTGKHHGFRRTRRKADGDPSTTVILECLGEKLHGTQHYDAISESSIDMLVWEIGKPFQQGPVPLGSRLNKQHLNVDKLMRLDLKTVRGQTDPTRY